MTIVKTGNPDGLTKAGWHNVISKHIYKETSVICSPAAIKAKMLLMESKFQNITDWMSNTGSGIDSGTQGYWDYVYAKCPYYDTLFPILGDHTSIRPVLTTDHTIYEGSSSYDNIDRTISENSLNNE